MIWPPLHYLCCQLHNTYFLILNFARKCKKKKKKCGIKTRNPWLEKLAKCAQEVQSKIKNKFEVVLSKQALAKNANSYSQYITQTRKNSYVMFSRLCNMHGVHFVRREVLYDYTISLHAYQRRLPLTVKQI